MHVQSNRYANDHITHVIKTKLLLIKKKTAARKMQMEASVRALAQTEKRKENGM